MKYPKSLGLRLVICVWAFLLGGAWAWAQATVAYDADGLKVAPAYVAAYAFNSQPYSVWRTDSFVTDLPVSSKGYHVGAYPNGPSIQADGYDVKPGVNGGSFRLSEARSICVNAYAYAQCGAYDQSGSVRIRNSSGALVFSLDRTSSGTGFQSFLQFLWPDCEPGPGPVARYNHKSLAAYGADHTGGNPSVITFLRYRQNLSLPADTYTVTLASTTGFNAVYLHVFLPKPSEGLKLMLKGESTAPTATLTADVSSLVQGQALTLSLGQTLAAATGRKLAGPGLASNPLPEPGPSVVASPTTVGTASYSYTVPGGSVSLSWRADLMTGTFMLNLPDGSSVDVTGAPSYDATLAGTYTITQTNALGTATSEGIEVVLPAPAVATVAVTVLEAPTVNLSLDASTVTEGSSTTARTTANPSGVIASHVLEYRQQGASSWVQVSDFGDTGGSEQTASVAGSLSMGVYEFRARAARSSGPTGSSAVITLWVTKASTLVEPTPPVEPRLPEPQIPDPGLPLPGPTPVVASAKPVLRLVESSVFVAGAGGLYEGKHYKRGWLEGTQAYAYLGRAGVRFEGTGSGLVSGGTMQLQAKSPELGAEWTELVVGVPVGVPSGGVSAGYSCGFEVRLGEVQTDAPLIPRSYAEGHALTGEWLFRTRVSDGTGDWSEWSEVVPVQVVLPLSVKEETLQSLPPAGVEGEWFSASAPKTFRIGLWIP